MMRHITLTLTTLLTGFVISQAEVLVNVRVQEPFLIDLEESVTIDLGDHFQLYSDPGPVASFSLRMPVQTGLLELQYQTTGNSIPFYDPEGPTLEMMTYELLSGETYSHVFDPNASGENFAWKEAVVNFQLLADVAPGTVGNFMQYVSDDSYDNTIVHRSQIGIVQFGRYRLNDSEDYLLQEIDTRSFIEFEETIDNAQGTLAMARGNTLNSAQSEFYINLVDNTEGLAKFYSVFGQVMDFDTNMPILEEMGDAYVYDLSTFLGNVFTTTPLYSPFWQKKDNWLRIQDITIPEGTRTGVTYAYEFGDLDGEEGTSDNEAANQAAFDVSIDGNQLQISRNNSGVALVVVKGTFGDQERSFTIPVTGYDPEALNAFPTSSIETEGYLNSVWYGRMLAETYPEIMHENHGKQWVFYSEDEDSGAYDYYIFDMELFSWIYTYPGLFPVIYVFSTGHWMSYVGTTGGSEDNPRWFYNHNLEEWVVYQ